MNIRMKLLDTKCHPEKKNPYDVGFDLKSRHETVVIKPGMVVKIPTGLIFEFPKTVFGMLVPRSGLGTKYGLRLMNTTGIIDPDYRGEIIAVVTTEKEITIEKYDRFAQLLFLPFVNPSLTPIIGRDAIETTRGADGFGSSGVK